MGCLGQELLSVATAVTVLVAMHLHMLEIMPSVVHLFISPFAFHDLMKKIL